MAAPPAATHDSRPEPALSPLETTIKKLERAAQKPQSASKILRFSLDALTAHLDLKLAALLVVDREKPGQLTLRSSSGTALPEAAKRVLIELDDNALIAKMLERPLAVHFDPERHSKGLAGLPLKLFGGRAGFLYSVQRRGKPLGVIIACRPKGQADPGARDLEIFTQLCRAAQSALNPKPN